MRATLRRSCDACARAKHACDLRTPRCSRCEKRKSACVYANEPLTSLGRPDLARSSLEATGASSTVAKSDEDTLAVAQRSATIVPEYLNSAVRLLEPPSSTFDPFDSYPPTRLPKPLIRRLIHHFLTSIAFQYYPLDLDTNSNPFVVSWWPRALADPALFHVSLQTASLDEERRSQNGFPVSELLMADSVSLVRRKVEDSALAFQDETLNSVVTLAAIEYGKGNTSTSRMHIDGIKRIIDWRGGINEVKRSSPLTARMVSWVSLVVTGAPQFQTQDDLGFGIGIEPIPQWQLAAGLTETPDATLDDLHLEPAMSNILRRLQYILQGPRASQLSSTDLHDLTCFVIHRLLLLHPWSQPDPARPAISECLRYALVLYMLILHGTTYYSHDDLAFTTMSRLEVHLKTVAENQHTLGALDVWILSVGMVSSDIRNERLWLTEQARGTATALGLRNWEDVLGHLRQILWTEAQPQEPFRQKWDEIFGPMAD